MEMQYSCLGDPGSPENREFGLNSRGVLQAFWAETAWSGFLRFVYRGDHCDSFTLQLLFPASASPFLPADWRAPHDLISQN